MAPNIARKTAPSEALDFYLSKHTSHHSLELDRDEKPLHKPMDNNKSLVSQENNSVEITTDVENVILSADIQNEAEKISVEDANLKDTKPVIVIPNRGKSLKTVENNERNLPSYTVEDTQKRFQNSDESVAHLNSDDLGTYANLENSRQEEDSFKTLRDIKKYANAHPEETLIAHDQSHTRELQQQKDHLLEQALMEPISIAREEQEWAEVEKTLAGDFSFARTLGEMLQYDINDMSYDTENGRHMFAKRVIPFGDGGHLVLPPSMVKEPTTKSISGTNYDIRDSSIKKRPGVAVKSHREIEVKPDYPSDPYESRQAEEAILNRDSKLSDKIDSDLDNIHYDIIDYIVSSNNTNGINSLPLSLNVNQTNISIDTTTQLGRSKVTMRRKNVTSTSTMKPVSEAILPQGQKTPYTPEGIAQLNLVHHDLTEPFLRDQGAKELTPNNMTAMGATAVILSGVCFLFLMLIWLAFFFKQQRKRVALQKEAEKSGQLEHKQIPGEDGKYNLHPNSLTSIKTSGSMSKKSMCFTNDFMAYDSSSPQKTPFKASTLAPSVHRSPKDSDTMAEKMAAKSKMIETQQPSCETYSEVAAEDALVCLRDSRSAGQLWFSLQYDEQEHMLLLHVQQARFSQLRVAGKVWVGVTLLTTDNDVHSTASTPTTTATQNPVFNHRMAFPVASVHVPRLMVRLTLHSGLDSNLGCVIMPLSAKEVQGDKEVQAGKTIIKDLH